MNEQIQKNDYNHFLQDVLTKIQQTRYEMLMSASKQTLLLYWDIGRMVSEKMQNAGWGAKVVAQLSKDLQAEIPGVRGFSVRNIWRMKMFADFYAQFEICATTVAKLETPLISAPTGRVYKICGKKYSMLNLKDSYMYRNINCYPIMRPRMGSNVKECK